MRRVLLLGLACFAATAAVPPTAVAHPHSLPPPIAFDLQIRDDYVTAFLNAEVPVLEMWRGGRRWPRPKAPEARAAALGPLVALLAAHVSVTIDGRPAEAEAVDLRLFESYPVPGRPPVDDAVEVTVRYPVRAPPRRITLRWNDFTGALWENEIQVPSLIESGTKVSGALLSPEEPEHTWHRPPTAHASPTVDVTDRPTVRATSAAVAGGIAPAVALTSGLPSCLGRRLDPATARRVFNGLHADLLASLETATGPDTDLSRWVTPRATAAVRATLEAPRILPPVVGGVVGTVIEVTPRDIDVVLPAAPWTPAFVVEGHWQLRIRAEHFEHAHERIVLDHARWRVRRDRGQWKIDGVEIVDRRVIDPDPEGNLPDLYELEDDR